MTTPERKPGQTSSEARPVLDEGRSSIRLRYPKKLRLKSRSEIDQVFRLGRYRKLGFLQAKFLPRGSIPVKPVPQTRSRKSMAAKGPGPQAEQDLGLGPEAKPAGWQPSGPSRFMVSVARKVGPAPVRNRIKRLVREAFRLNGRKLQNSYDICVFIKPPCPAQWDFTQVEGEVLALIAHLNRVNGKGGAE